MLVVLIFGFSGVVGLGHIWFVEIMSLLVWVGGWLDCVSSWRECACLCRVLIADDALYVACFSLVVLCELMTCWFGSLIYGL